MQLEGGGGGGQWAALEQSNSTALHALGPGFKPWYLLLKRQSLKWKMLVTTLPKKIGQPLWAA